MQCFTLVLHPPRPARSFDWAPDQPGAAPPAVLVLDDYHVIADAAIHCAVAFVLNNLPLQLYLVIATRADPPLPLSRWRSRDQRVKVRDCDLRFTGEETTVLLIRVMALNLSPDEITALQAHTEGWIVGLQMATISLVGRPTKHIMKAAVAGSESPVPLYTCLTPDLPR